MTTRRIIQRGLYFEEFELDTVYQHSPGRTVTEADNVLFTTLTMNTQSLHLDAAWSEQTEFGERLVVRERATLAAAEVIAGKDRPLRTGQCFKDHAHRGIHDQIGRFHRWSLTPGSGIAIVQSRQSKRLL